MDVTSYLLGKNASGGGGGGVEEYFNTEVTLVSGSVSQPITRDMIKTLPDITLASNYLNLSNAFANHYVLETAPKITTENVTEMNSMFSGCKVLTKVPNYNTANVTDMSYMFYYCSALETAPQMNTSKVTNFSQMFNYCGELKNVPIYNFSSATVNSNFGNMFRNCLKLTDESLDNILQSCITATSFTGAKNLTTFGISSTYYYPVERIQALPHYQDFVNAGWSIGYQ